MVKSMKPGKQRKAHYNAPIHQKRKRVAARLQLAKPDARFAGVRTVTVRVGDVVQVTVATKPTVASATVASATTNP